MKKTENQLRMEIVRSFRGKTKKAANKKAILKPIEEGSGLFSGKHSRMIRLDLTRANATILSDLLKIVIASRSRLKGQKDWRVSPMYITEEELTFFIRLTKEMDLLFAQKS
jgi:hypothetical protein